MSVDLNEHFFEVCSEDLFSRLFTDLLLSSTDFQVTDETWSTNQAMMSGLEAYYDRHHATIYLNVLSLFEGPMFLNMCRSIESTLTSHSNSEEDFDIESWIRSQKNAEMKLALHAFLLSDVILLVQEELQLDLDCLELLKNLANVKALLSAQLDKTDPKLESLQRLMTSPVPSLSVIFDATKSLKSANLPKSADTEAFIAEAQKSLEQQCRSLLRRLHFETLFQSHASQIAHVVHLGDAPLDSTLHTLTLESELPTCHSSRSIQDLRRWLVSKMHAVHASAHHIGPVTPSSTADADAKKKKKGKTRPKTFAEGWSLATAQEWFSLSHSLLQWLCADNSAPSIFEDGGMDANEIFSAECCRHALQSARSTYFAGLPAIYGSIYHNKRIQLALRVFGSLARGPLTESSKTQFLAECNAYWNADHRKCDAVSLTNRPCTHSYHVTREDGPEPNPSKSLGLKMSAALAASAPAYSPSKSSNTRESTNSPSVKGRKEKENASTSTTPSSAQSQPVEPPLLPHSSGYRCLHRCNCGKSQTSRSDPFTLDQANTTFFSNPACCRYLPSLLESHLRKIRAQSEKDGLAEKEDVEDLQLLAMPHSWRLENLGWEATVIGAKSDNLTPTQGGQPLSKSQNLTPAPSPSISVYIAGQSGFYDGCDALLPWTINLRGSMAFAAATGNSTFDTSTSAYPDSSSSDSIQLPEFSTSSQAYIGIEYECHEGHRWLADLQHFASISASSPDNSDTSAKPFSSDIQSLLETSFLPIYSRCKCGDKVAQLQRIFIATPRDPSIRIAFNPIVHAHGKAILEDDGTPKKFTLDSGIQDHLVLPQDHVVCIRLPYIYTLDDKPLLQGDMENDAQCRFFLEPRSFSLVTT